MKVKFDTDRIVAFSAIFISLLTLIIFIYQTGLIREQNRLSVLPRLGFNEVVSQNDTRCIIRCELRNKGLGPAIIESNHILYQGKTLSADYAQFFEQHFSHLDSIFTVTSSTILDEGNTLGEKESITLFSIEVKNKHLEQFNSIYNSTDKEQLFDIKITYSSIYKEQWMIRLSAENSRPQEI